MLTVGKCWFPLTEEGQALLPMHVWINQNKENLGEMLNHHSLEYVRLPVSLTPLRNFVLELILFNDIIGISWFLSSIMYLYIGTVNC